MSEDPGYAVCQEKNGSKCRFFVETTDNLWRVDFQSKSQVKWTKTELRSNLKKKVQLLFVQSRRLMINACSRKLLSEKYLVSNRSNDCPKTVRVFMDFALNRYIWRRYSVLEGFWFKKSF